MIFSYFSYELSYATNKFHFKWEKVKNKNQADKLITLNNEEMRKFAFMVCKYIFALCLKLGSIMLTVTKHTHSSLFSNSAKKSLKIKKRNQIYHCTLKIYLYVSSG